MQASLLTLVLLGYVLWRWLGRKSLHELARIGRVDKVQVKLAHNPAAVHALDDHGRTALHWAAFAGNLTVVRLLLECGADPLARDPHGVTPLIAAEQAGRDLVARSLRNATVAQTPTAEAR